MLSKPFIARLTLPFFVLIFSGNSLGISPDFELVSGTIYAQTMRDAKNAYNDKQYALAFPKFERLACAGDKMSQNLLGHMYLLGEGVARDDVKGYSWLKVAAEYPFPPFQIIVKQIEERLTPGQKALFTRNADAMTQAYGLRATNMSCSLSASSGFSSNIKDMVGCTARRLGPEFLLRRCVDRTLD